ncbi:hypothetical protein [Brachyspira innocens]|uniref:hypothetical protein n=1 Tax=Brachyspira innocens TaxID=13264 RepID=UPI0026EC0945|nr:hypothetical protein [Brachyspira innocens]
MTALFDKFKNSVSQNKKFFLVYLIVILAVVLSLISLSILGSIERTGYLTGFNKILDNYYACRINYYSSIFRNSDIYGVYPYFTNNYTYTPGNEYGTPFGSAFINKELKDNDRVDIQYKLKLKYNIIFFSIIFLLLFPILYLYVIPNIIKNYKYYILLFFINSAIYLIIPIILKQFSIVTIRYHYADIVLSFIFLMIAFNLLNNKLLYTLLFEIINIFSFFVIQPLGLTFQNNILLFTDMPNLYFSLLAVSSFPIKILLIISSIIYFSLILFIIISSIYYLVKRKNKIASSIMIIMIIILVYTVFFRKTDVNLAWPNIIGQAYRNGIIDTINYRINYDRIRNVKYSREDVLNAVNTLKNFEEKRDYSNLILTNSVNNRRDIFLIFLESFYDYSHFTNMFDKDPFPEEYRQWANNSRKISPNDGGGSFNARLTGLTASSPLTPKMQNTKNKYSLPHLLDCNGYYTIALEEADNTYNLNTFLPSIYFDEIVFKLGTTNIDNYLQTNIKNFNSPIFVYGFTTLGHAGVHIDNDLNIASNNENFMNYFSNDDKLKIIETMDNSAMTAIEVIKTRDIILKYHPNALIIFKHDHLYPYLRGIIENSSIDNDIKMSFLNDNAPTPILIWDGTNGAYKAPNNFVPENIPMFIALNAGVTNYKNSIISLLYKEEIDGFISTYHKYYRITNDTLLLENNIDETSKIFKYENAQRILSQDIFQGRKYYYDLIKEYTNN